MSSPTPKRELLALYNGSALPLANVRVVIEAGVVKAAFTLGGGKGWKDFNSLNPQEWKEETALTQVCSFAVLLDDKAATPPQPRPLEELPDFLKDFAGRDSA